MQIGVSSYSFSRIVKRGVLKQIEVISKAKEMGFDFLEFSTIAVPEGKSLPEYAKELREESDRVGLPIVNYTIGGDFLNGSGGCLDQEVERLKGEVQVAKILGATGMRHDATSGFQKEDPRGKGFEEALPILIKGYRAVTEYAEKEGIRTMVENHGFFCQDSIRIERLISGVGHPNFGALIDMGNFICVDEDPGIAVGRLLPYAFHVHAKDFHLKPGIAPHPGKGWRVSRGGNFWRGSIIGHGDVPVIQVLEAMKRVEYEGRLSIEYEGMEDVLMGIEIGLENLKRYVDLVFG